MENKPQQPDELPPDGSVDPETAPHVDHGVPPAAADAEPTGMPTTDRHQGEVTPAKP